MYVYRMDDKDSLAVWALDRLTKEDWDLSFEHLREVATWSKKTGKRGACVLISRSFDTPDAKRRAELAALCDAPGYDPYVAFVSANSALRAVLTMFKWVQKSPAYEMDYFATSDDALKWLSEKRGGRLVGLERMVREVERELAAGGRLRAHG